MRPFLTLIFVSSLMAGTVLGQGRDSSLFAYPIQLDEVVIRARSSGWDLDAFMDRVRQDTSFFKAFKTSPGSGGGFFQIQWKLSILHGLPLCLPVFYRGESLW